jgi:hypothetical protein
MPKGFDRDLLSAGSGGNQGAEGIPSAISRLDERQ